MAAYIVKRILASVPTLLLLIVATFALIRFVPGGPFDSEKALPQSVRENLEQKYHLNDSVVQQISDYLFSLAKGDLGVSYRYMGSRTVSEIIFEAFPTSLLLGIAALSLACLVGVPIGVFSAASQTSSFGFRRRWLDRLLMAVATSGISLPSFLLVCLLVMVFSLWLEWFPPALWEDWRSAVLPILALSFRPLGLIARMTRASMIEVLKREYIRSAKAKGLTAREILFKHALKNAILPVISYVGPMTAAILTGSFVVEVMFAIPGLGKHFVSAVLDRDYPLIIGVSLVYGVVIIVANLVVDCLYSVFDSRVRLS